SLVFEARIVRPTNEKVWIEFRGSMRRDAAGHVTSAAGLVLNIEERKRQEARFERLRREAEALADRLQLATVSAKAGAFEIDLKARTFWRSAEFDQIVQTPMTFDEVNQPAWPVCHPDDIDAIGGAYDGVRRMEWRLMRPDGAVRWVETSVK